MIRTKESVPGVGAESQVGKGGLPPLSRMDDKKTDSMADAGRGPAIPSRSVILHLYTNSVLTPV